MDQLLSNTLREKRQRIIDMEYKPIIDLAKKENRAFTGEERTKLDAMDADIDALTADIARAEKSEQRKLTEAAPAPAKEPSQAIAVIDVDEQKRHAEAYQRAFIRYVRHGMQEMGEEERAILRTGWQGEQRAQATTPGASGGFTIPQGFVPQLEASMKMFGSMLVMADVFDTDTGADLPWPTYDDTTNTGALLSENTQVALQDVAFGQIVFKAYKYSSKAVLVSVELLQDTAFDFNTILAAVLGERIGRIINTHFTTGDNTGKPQGFITAASTVAAGSATAIAGDDLVNLFHGVDPAYRSGPKVAWTMADSTLAAVRKLKETTGNFLWQPGLMAGIPDTILGKPYFINQDMDAIATGKKTVGFGDFSKYKIRRVLGVTLLRLVERYADYHQVGFLAFARYDGRTLDAGTDPIKVLLHP